MALPTNSEKRGDEISLAEAIRRWFAPFGGVELELAPAGADRAASRVTGRLGRGRMSAGAGLQTRHWQKPCQSR
jgi:hypothetical protein